MFALIGQTAETLETGYKFADRFGFEALVAIVLLIGGGYLALKFIDVYKATSDRLATASESAYSQHVEIAKESLTLSKQVQECITCLTASTTAIESAIRVMTESSADRQKSLDAVENYTEKIHKAGTQTLRLMAQMLECTEPMIAKEMLRIAESMEANPPRPRH